MGGRGGECVEEGKQHKQEKTIPRGAFRGEIVCWSIVQVQLTYERESRRPPPSIPPTEDNQNPTQASMSLHLSHTHLAPPRRFRDRLPSTYTTRQASTGEMGQNGFRDVSVGVCEMQLEGRRPMGIKAGALHLQFRPSCLKAAMWRKGIIQCDAYY